MTIATKICGISDAAALDAAVAGGAHWVGLMFYPPSPRALDLQQAAALTARMPDDGPERVGVFVDPDDALLVSTIAACEPHMLQLHGAESPARVREIRARFGRPVMKACKIAEAPDVAAARDYDGVADCLLFDARAPENAPDALPGGNGLSFDWRLLKDTIWQIPWMLSGGLEAGNVAAAVAATGARAVDVSSGVESAPGRKDPAAITAFLDAVRAL